MVMYISLAFGGLMIIGSLLVVRSHGAVGVALMMGLIMVAQALFILFLVKYKVGMWTHVGTGYLPFILKKIEHKRY